MHKAWQSDSSLETGHIVHVQECVCVIAVFFFSQKVSLRDLKNSIKLLNNICDNAINSSEEVFHLHVGYSFKMS